MYKPKHDKSLYTWGVKAIEVDFVVMFNMTKDEAIRVAAGSPSELRAAAIQVRRCTPKNMETAKIVHADSLSVGDTL